MNKRNLLIVVWACVSVLTMSHAVAKGLACSDHTLMVELAPGGADVEVVGTLCSRGSRDGKTVQLLLSGATYARAYWDFPFQPNHYSYVRAAVQRGYVTFNLERIGTTALPQPPDGFFVDISATAHVAHQVVDALRNGHVGGVAFDKVIIVGHSLGSFTAIELAREHPNDIDGLLLTGYLHHFNPDFFPTVTPVTIPAAIGVDNYFTTLPGVRDMLFYHLPQANPKVIAEDEETKGTVALGELIQAPGLADIDAPGVDIPVLMMIGEFDFVVCGGAVNCSDQDSVEAHEKAFWEAGACLDIVVVKNSGHVLNLHKHAGTVFARMLHWANRMVGKKPGPAPQPCNG